MDLFEAAKRYVQAVDSEEKVGSTYGAAEIEYAEEMLLKAVATRLFDRLNADLDPGTHDVLWIAMDGRWSAYGRGALPDRLWVG
jgi:hypothetical protein